MLLVIRVVHLFEFIKEDDCRLFDLLNQLIEIITTERLIDENRNDATRCTFNRKILAEQGLARSFLAIEHHTGRRRASFKGIQNTFGVPKGIAIEFWRNGERINLCEVKCTSHGVFLHNVCADRQCFVQIKLFL